MGSALKKLFPLTCIFGDDLVDDDTAFIGRYQGEKNLLGDKEGYGTYYFKNGDVYEGCWKNNVIHGYGTYYYASGEKKCGFFDHGKYIGKEANDTYSEIEAEPFVQTVCDEKEQTARNLEREERRKERAKKKKDRERRRAEFREKYGDRSCRQRDVGATNGRQ